SYHKSCAIVPVSFGYVQTIKSNYNIDDRKIFVIEHGVNTELFRKTGKPEIGKSKKIVMYSGAITVGYDFESVIAAARILESKPIHFIIRGIGELTLDIKQKIKEWGLDNIEIRDELLPLNELISLLNSADIFLLPMSQVGI